MLKFARNNRSSSVDRSAQQDRISVSSLSPPATKTQRIASPPSPSPTSSNSPATSSTRRRSRTSSLERVSMRNSWVNNQVILSQYYSQQNQKNSCRPSFIIPKSHSMFVESAKSHRFDETPKVPLSHNPQPLSLDSHQSQQNRDDKKCFEKSNSVRTANIVACHANNISSSATTNSSFPPKSIIKPMTSPTLSSQQQWRNQINQQLNKINNGKIIKMQNEKVAVGNDVTDCCHNQQEKNTSPDYEAVYSGTFCRLLPPPTMVTASKTSPSGASPSSLPMTPTLQKLSAAIHATNNSVIKLKSVLKKRQMSGQNNNIKTANASTNSDNSSSVQNSGYDFHRAIEKLVEKMDLQLLDTSSESGYGSDQDSLTSNNSNATTGTANQAAVANKILLQGKHVTPKPTDGDTTTPPSLPPRIAINGSSASSPLPRRQPPPIPSPINKSTSSSSSSSPVSSSVSPQNLITKKNRVRFDSYVLFLQGLRERDLELVQTHIRDVCDAALTTDEVVAEFLAAVIESREAIVRELLAFGFSANTVADPAGMTPLHLAAAFNNLPLVRILLAHGAAAFTRAHSSGKVASELCSRQLPGYQACHAYLRCMEECLGVANGGKVFSTQCYRTTRCDELGLEAGEELMVIRKGDYNGSSWWWCSNRHGQQGYVLQDLLALNTKSNA